MAIPSVHCEARLKGIAKRHDKGGDYAQITLQVQPQDLPEALWQAPLGSIWMVAFARVGDDGEPVEQEPEKPKRPGRPFADMPPSQQAGMLCNDEGFQRWASRDNPCPDIARALILGTCCIKSRKELDSSGEASFAWDNMLSRFRAETGRTAEQRG